MSLLRGSASSTVKSQSQSDSEAEKAEDAAGSNPGSVSQSRLQSHSQKSVRHQELFEDSSHAWSGIAISSENWNDHFEIRLAKSRIIDTLADGDKKVSDRGAGSATFNFDPTQIGVPKVPDGGYGWVIVLASFLCNVIVDGIINSFGIFLSTFVSDFKESQAAVSVASSLLNGTLFVAGPIGSALTNKFGCRAVCIAGALITATGMGISALAQSLEVFIFTYSIIGGIGLSFIYLPSVVCVGYYFEKKRALAIGIALCGSGIGTFFVPPVCSVLLPILGWRYVHLILAGVTTFVVYFGYLMKPLEIRAVEVISDIETTDGSKRSLSKSSIGFAGPHSNEDMVVFEDHEDTKSIGSLGSGPKHAGEKSNSNSKTSQPDTTSGRKLSNNSDGDDTGLKHPTKITFVAVPLGSAPTAAVSIGQRHSWEETPLFDGHGRRASSDEDHSPQQSAERTTGDARIIYAEAEDPELLMPEPKIIIRTLTRNDIFYTGSIEHIAGLSRKSGSERADEDKGPLHEGQVDLGHERAPTLCRCCPCLRSTGAFKSALSRMVDCSLMTSPVFLFIGVNNMFLMLAYFTPYVFLVDAAISKGVPERDAAFFISLIGITNTVGRVISGFISYFPRLSALSVNNAALFLSGAVLAIVPSCGLYYHYVLFSLGFGLLNSFYVSLTSIILVDLLGLESLTNAFGLLMLFRGSATFFGVPVAGAIFDATKSYDIPFYLAGGLYTIAAGLSAMIPLVAKFSKTRNKSGSSPQLHTFAMKDEKKAHSKLIEVNKDVG